MRLHNNSSVTNHLNDFNTLTSKLALVGVKIVEEDKAAILLCSLPETWDKLVMGHSNFAPSGKLVFEEVAVVIFEDSRWKTS